MSLILHPSAFECSKIISTPLLLDIRDAPRPLNSFYVNTTGQPFVEILNATSATATHANEVEPAVTHPLVFSARYQFLIVGGKIFRWISLLVYPGLMVSMLSWLLSAASLKCVTSFLVAIQLP